MLRVDAAPGPVVLDSTPVVCQTADFPATGFPRRVYVDLVFAGTAALGDRRRGRPGAEHRRWNFGTPLTAQGSRGYVPAAAWGNLANLAHLDLAVGQSVRFGARIGRGAGAGTANLTDSRCELRALVFSRDGATSPLSTASPGRARSGAPPPPRASVVARRRAGEGGWAPVASAVPAILDATPMATASFSTPVLIDRALLRATGAPRSDGNAVRPLRDARENYPAWLAAIAGASGRSSSRATSSADDAVGQRLCRRAGGAALEPGLRCGWCTTGSDSLGSHGTLGRTMTEAGAEVRAFNPFSFGSPFGWVSRDHRKTIAIDGAVAVRVRVVRQRELGGRRGEAPRTLARHRVVEIRGPAVAEIERAFALVWDACGEPLLPIAC